MISPSFETLIRGSIKDSIVTALAEGLGESEAITLQDNVERSNIDEEQVIILTISSHVFRLLIVMNLTMDDTFDGYISQCLGQGGNSDKTKVYDYLNEVGNLLCGSLKRDLQSSVNALGMSTPNLLKAETLNHVDSLKVDQEYHLRVSFSGEKLMYVSYYLSAYGDLDVQTQTHSESDVGVSELEFF
jgi:hypothetical protein